MLHAKGRAILQRDSIWAWLLLLGLLIIYHLNCDFLYVRDAEGSVFLPVSMLNEGNLSFSPSEMPFMFFWELQSGNGTSRKHPPHWRDLSDGGPLQALYRGGALKVVGPKYNVFPSIRVDTSSGERLFVNTFGIGAGLTALPFFAVLHVAVGDLRDHPLLVWYAAKSVASLLVAASAAFIFLAARCFLRPRPAALLALSYGLGTGVWSTSSQTLWQHAPNEFFLALGSYFLFRLRDELKTRYIVSCAVAFACAALCRPPTSAPVAAIVGIYLAVRDFKAGVTYALAALPIALAAASYNVYYVGSPLLESQVATWAAQQATGSPVLWQTPLFVGLAGLLISPSRGLLVFSPFLVGAVGGIRQALRDKRFAVLVPLAAGLVPIFLLESKYFDWWGGWSYGYRHIVDACVLLSLLLIPVMDWIVARRWRLAIFMALLCWSVGVQFVGAFAYDGIGWNARLAGYYVRLPGETNSRVVEDLEQAKLLVARNGATIVGAIRQDIGDPEHRHRLWSLGDNQIGYYCARFRESRRAKLRIMVLATE